MSISDSQSVETGVTRRRFLSKAWLTSFGFLSAGFLAVFTRFSLPVKKKGEYGTTITVAPVTEIPGVGDPPLNQPRGKFWLVNSENGLLAFYKACTHLDCLFNWNRAENSFVCPCHGSKFSRDGAVMTGPAARALDQFPVQVVSPDGEVLGSGHPEAGILMAIQTRTEESEGEEKRSVWLRINRDQEVIEEREIPENATISVDTGRKIQFG